MEKKSEQLLFEEAAFLRDRLQALQRILRQQRVMAQSVKKQNLVIITLARKTYVELHFIKSGMLARQMLVDQKHMKQAEIRAALEHVFFSKQAEIFGSRKEDINEMRIIASWCLTRRDDSTVIEADGFDDLDTLLSHVVERIEAAGKTGQLEKFAQRLASDL
jgi:excinuclease UvrABC nuclease subunit